MQDPLSDMLGVWDCNDQETQLVHVLKQVKNEFKLKYSGWRGPVANLSALVHLAQKHHQKFCTKKENEIYLKDS